MYGTANTTGPTGPAGTETGPRCARCGTEGERLAALSGAAPMCVACRQHLSAVRARQEYGHRADRSPSTGSCGASDHEANDDDQTIPQRLQPNINTRIPTRPASRPQGAAASLRQVQTR